MRLVLCALVVLGCGGDMDMEHMAKMYGLKEMRVQDLPASPASELYEQVCTACHGLPDVKSHTAWQWGYVVDRMGWYVDNDVLSGAKEIDVAWNDDVRMLITDYLQANANEEVAELPATPVVEAKLYASECSTCHPAPDPRTHNMMVWSHVIDRMYYIKTEIFDQRAWSDSTMRDIMDYLEVNSGPAA